MTSKQIILGVSTQLMSDKHVGFPVIQIYVYGPNTSQAAVTDEDISEYLSRREKEKEREKEKIIMIHGSHLDHLCGKRNNFSLINVKKEIDIGCKLHARGLIIHITPDQADCQFVDQLAKCYEYLQKKKEGEENSLNLYVEIHPKAPCSIQSLGEMFEKCREKNIKIGLVIDTAHLHSAGINIASKESAELYLQGLSNLASTYKSTLIDIAFHLNDQVYDFGSKKDKHANLTQGTIWSNDSTSLITILDFISQNNHICILERNDCQPDLTLLRKLGYHF